MISPLLFDVQVVAGVEDGATTLVVIGEFDVAAAEQFTAAAERAAAGGPSSIVIDLDGATLIDSAAIGAILRVRRRAMEKSVAIRVVAPRPYQVELFRITGLSHVLADGSPE